MILVPGTTHVITWSKQLLSDTATYYVQAVIRDTRTNEVLETLDLTDVDGNYFRKAWTVVQDPTGFGREIEIQKTVYDDAEYTIPSSIYGRWLDQYTVLQIVPIGGPGSGAGGGGMDYNVIESILEKQLKLILGILLETINGSKVDLTGISEVVNSLKTGSQHEETIRGVHTSISEISELARGIQKLLPEVTNHMKVTRSESDTKTTQIKEMVQKAETAIAGILENVTPKLEKKIDAELTRVVDITAKNFEKLAEDLGNKVSLDLESQLSKPLKLNMPFDASATREEKPKEEKPLMNPRVDRLIKMTS